MQNDGFKEHARASVSTLYLKHICMAQIQAKHGLITSQCIKLLICNAVQLELNLVYGGNLPLQISLHNSILNVCNKEYR